VFSFCHVVLNEVKKKWCESEEETELNRQTQVQKILPFEELLLNFKENT
jgi:hypothetical protein